MRNAFFLDTMHKFEILRMGISIFFINKINMPSFFLIKALRFKKKYD